MSLLSPVPRWKNQERLSNVSNVTQSDLYNSRAEVGIPFCEGSDGKYFGLYGPYSLCLSVATTQLCCCIMKATINDNVNEWACLCFNKTLFTKTGHLNLTSGSNLCESFSLFSGESVLNCEAYSLFFKINVLESCRENSNQVGTI